jgi:hypothetical protein
MAIKKEAYESTAKEWKKKLTDFESKTLTKEDIEKIRIKAYKSVI